MADQQPNIPVIANSLRAAANEVELLVNLPAFQDGEWLRQQFAGINGRLDQMNDRMNDRHVQTITLLHELQNSAAANDNNSMARSLNASITRETAQLHPLRTQANEEVENFPQTMAALNALNSPQINAILRQYNLSVVGQVGDRRLRLSHYCGVGWHA